MRNLRILLLIAGFAIPAALWADFSDYGLPPATKWYFHADLTEMRGTEAGRHVYGWLQKEVFAELRDEIGIDVDREIDRVTAFAAQRDLLTVVVEGDISQATQDKALAIGAATGSLDKYAADGMDYYYVKADRQAAHDDGNPLQDGVWFSFAVDERLLLASTETELERLLASRGRLEKTGGTGDRGGELLVVSTDNSLLQAGLDTDELEEEIGWDSNLVRNTRQVALTMADDAGKLVVEAQLLAAENAIAESLASIARGLISLQVFNDDMDPGLREVLQSAKIDVDGSRLRLRIALDPHTVIAAIE